MIKKVRNLKIITLVIILALLTGLSPINLIEENVNAYRLEDKVPVKVNHIDQASGQLIESSEVELAVGTYPISTFQMSIGDYQLSPDQEGEVYISGDPTTMQEVNVYYLLAGTLPQPSDEPEPEPEPSDEPALRPEPTQEDGDLSVIVNFFNESGVAIASPRQAFFGAPTEISVLELAIDIDGYEISEHQLMNTIFVNYDDQPQSAIVVYKRVKDDDDEDEKDTQPSEKESSSPETSKKEEKTGKKDKPADITDEDAPDSDEEGGSNWEDDDFDEDEDDDDKDEDDKDDDEEEEEPEEEDIGRFMLPPDYTTVIIEHYFVGEDEPFSRIKVNEIPVGVIVPHSGISIAYLMNFKDAGFPPNQEFYEVKKGENVFKLYYEVPGDVDEPDRPGDDDKDTPTTGEDEPLDPKDIDKDLIDFTLYYIYRYKNMDIELAHVTMQVPNGAVINTHAFIANIPGYVLMPFPPNQHSFIATPEHNKGFIYYTKYEKPGKNKYPPTITIEINECPKNPWRIDCPGDKVITVTELLIKECKFKGCLLCTGPPRTVKVNEKCLETYTWDNVYDVIVYGSDVSASVAAITAAEKGASVLMVVNAPRSQSGGHTRESSQEMLYVKDKKKAIEFVQALQGSYDGLDAVTIRTFVEGAIAMPTWLKAHGAAKLYNLEDMEYSELPGADGVGICRISEKASYDAALYNLCAKNLKKLKNKIKFTYSTEALSLIQDPASKAVMGMQIRKKGKIYNLRALNGVVLANGGFENNEDMIENFLQLPEAYSKFAKYNDGSGIKIAMKAGSDLWRMNNVAGCELHCKLPLNADHLKLQSMLQGVRKYQLGPRSCIIVGKNGRRFTNEAAKLRLGHIDSNGMWQSQRPPEESWVIFDEAGLKQHALYQGWSKDNMKEVNKGLILKADTLEDLAKQAGIDKQGLLEQVEDYNNFCDEGRDLQCQRDKKYLNKIADDGPYYAMPLIPTLTFTLGGPRRNAAAEVIDVDGNVIPSLYAAGNAGSWFGDIFPTGADMTEAIVSGQLAGMNAASKKSYSPATKVKNPKFNP